MSTQDGQMRSQIRPGVTVEADTRHCQRHLDQLGDTPAWHQGTAARWTSRSCAVDGGERMSGGFILTSELVLSYLKRLGIRAVQPPTLEFLRELHRAHVSDIPWQTIDVFSGRPRPIDMETSVRMIVENRSGYCFHLNGAFASLLRSLGYTVSLHRAGVQSYGGIPVIDSFHLGLTVQIHNEFQEEQWIVDVGLGDMPYEPLPLISGYYKQGPFVYTVADSQVNPAGWRVEHDPNGSFVGMDVDPGTVVGMAEFETNHLHLSRSSDSPWVKLLILKNRCAAETHELKGCIFTVRDKHGVHRSEVDDQAAWLEILADVFGERLPDYSLSQRNALWEKVIRSHEEWKQSSL